MNDSRKKEQVVIESTRPTRDDLTPITDIRGMGQAISIIKRDVREMRPDVKEAARGVIELTTKQAVTDNQIKSLEVKTERIDREVVTLAQSRSSHDCMNANVISELKEESKQNALGVVTVTKDAIAASTDIDELKNGQSKFIYWLLGAAFVVAGSIVAWYASYNVTQNEVRHLTEEQVKIRNNLEELQKTTKALPVKVDNAAQRLESAAQKIQENDEDIRLVHVWCLLSPREKIRLRQKISEEKIPKVRCKR